MPMPMPFLCLFNNASLLLLLLLINFDGIFGSSGLFNGMWKDAITAGGSSASRKAQKPMDADPNGGNKLPKKFGMKGAQSDVVDGQKRKQSSADKVSHKLPQKIKIEQMYDENVSSIKAEKESSETAEGGGGREVKQMRKIKNEPDVVDNVIKNEPLLYQHESVVNNVIKNDPKQRRKIKNKPPMLYRNEDAAENVIQNEPKQMQKIKNEPDIVDDVIKNEPSFSDDIIKNEPDVVDDIIKNEPDIVDDVIKNEPSFSDDIIKNEPDVVDDVIKNEPLLYQHEYVADLMVKKSGSKKPVAIKVEQFLQKQPKTEIDEPSAGGVSNGSATISSDKSTANLLSTVSDNDGGKSKKRKKDDENVGGGQLNDGANKKITDEKTRMKIVKKNKKITDEKTKMKIVEKYNKMRKEQRKNGRINNENHAKMESEIAKELGSTRHEIQAWIRESKIVPDMEQKVRIIEAFYQIIAEVESKGNFNCHQMRAFGVEIAKKLGVYLNIIHKWRREFGMTRQRNVDDETKIAVIEKFEAMKRERKQREGYRNKDRTQMETEIAKELNHDRNKLYTWKRQLALSQQKIFSVKEKRKLINKFDELGERIATEFNLELTKAIEEKIAKKLNVTRRTIYNWKQQFGLIQEKKQRKFSNAEKRDLIERFDEILRKNPLISAKELDKLMPVKRTTINEWKRQQKREAAAKQKN